MVGVPGRSKGCNTCRKRKIGCDQKRPECGNCIKSNRVCAGYHRAVVFRNATGPALNPHATKTLSSPDPPIDSLDGGGSSSGSAATKDVVPVRPYSRSVGEVDFPLLVAPPAQPHYRSALVANYMVGLMPPNCQSFGVPLGWIHLIPFLLNGATQVFDTSVMAVCTAYASRGSGDEWLMQESTRLYTRALAEMNTALSNRKVRTRDETLAAAMSLTLYEAIGCTHVVGWQRHAAGMELLVRLRGPEAHSTGLGHLLFSSFRPASLTNSLVVSKHSFLASKEWCTVPWTNIPKHPSHELQDLLLELPGIIEDRSVLPHSAHLSLLGRCLDLKTRLEAWLQNFTSIPSAEHWLEFSALNIDPPVFPTCYRFANAGAASTYTSYWANLIILYSIIIGLTPTSQSPIVTVDEMYDLAARVCMSVEYHIAPGAGLYGPILIMYPLRVAAGCFKKMGVKGEKTMLWCKAIYKVLGERGIAHAKMQEKTVSWNKEVGVTGEGLAWGGSGFWERVGGGLAGRLT